MRYFHALRMPVIRARTFNLLGPGLPTTLACGSFVDSIVRLEKTDTAGADPDRQPGLGQGLHRHSRRGPGLRGAG